MQDVLQLQIVHGVSVGGVGTVIEFLDEAQVASHNFTPHSFHIEQSKTADREYDTNVVPVKGGWSPHDREIPLRIEVPRNRSRKPKRMPPASWECDQ